MKKKNIKFIFNTNTQQNNKKTLKKLYFNKKTNLKKSWCYLASNLVNWVEDLLLSLNT
jgi:hypothetical protein